MKKKILPILFTALASTGGMFIPTACSDGDNPIKEVVNNTVFDVDPITFEGIAEGQEAEIRFVAGNAWTATFTSSNNWLSASPTQGKAGEAIIRVTPYNDNKSSMSRSAELMVLVDGEDAPFTVRITQLSASESDITLSGDIENGVMTLSADNTGNKFVGTIEVTSSSKWEITADDTHNWLSFAKDQEPQDGKKTTVKLTVTADYKEFDHTTMNGAFHLQVPGATPIKVEVKAEATCKVYDTDTKGEEDVERVQFEMTDTLQRGLYQLTFYVESNIVWELKNLPEWMKLAGDITETSNRKADGTLQTRRVGVGLMVKDEYLSAESRSGVLQLTDLRGEVLKSIQVSFDGISSNFLQHDFAFPSTDPFGNDFSFEAKAAYIDPDNKNDYWKKVELPFNIKTSVDYASLDNAPYHLIMCNAHNGRVLNEEVHWASLRMGDASNRSESNGVFTKELYLRVNDRGDEDDLNGLTNPASMREAFIFIVPKQVTVDDLFNADGATLKEEYAEAFSHIMQKQDHEIDYELELKGLTDGETLYVTPDGGSFQFPIVKMTSEQISPKLIRLWLNQETGEWEEKEPTSSQENAIYIEPIRSESTGHLESLMVNVAPGMVTSTRGFRFRFNMFRGDEYADINVFTFDIKLKE